MRSVPSLLAPLALFTIGWISLPACSRNDVPPADSIRLVDVLERAEIESYLDLDSMPAVMRHLAKATPKLSFERAAIHRGGWVGSVVFPNEATPNAALAVVVVPTKREEAVCVRIPSGGSDAYFDRAFLVAIDRDVAGTDLADGESLGRVLADPRHARREIERTADGDAWAVLPAATRMMLLCVAARDGSPRVPPVEILFPGRQGRWLLETETLNGSPWARRIGRDRRTFEGMILYAPGRMTHRLRVPPRRPRFTTHVQAYWAKMADARLDVLLDGEVVWSGSIPHDPIAIDLDLSAHAGDSIELSFVAETDEGVDGSMLVFESPVLTGEPAEPPPDVILISLDTVRADRMSLHGGPRPTTPEIDELAQSSFVFEHAIAAAPWTLPSHVTMLSGQLPDRHGVYRGTGSIPRGLSWLPSDFRRAGYETIAFTASGYLDPRFGYSIGFESYRTTEIVYPREWAEQVPDFNGRDTRALAARAEVERTMLLDLLGAPRRRPLFLFVHTYQAHEYRGKPEVLARFGGEPAEMETLLDGAYGASQRENPFFVKDPDESVRQELQSRAELMYDASLFSADELVGEIVGALEETGRLDRTIVVVTSDHGEALMERGVIGHGRSLFEEQIRVPLVVRGPGIGAARVDDVVSLVDLAPTLRELCRLVPDGIDLGPMEDGRSLVPLFSGGTIEPRAALSRGGEREAEDLVFRTLRGGRYKLIVEATPAGGTADSIYDLDADPAERIDVAESRAEDVRAWKEQLDRWVLDLTSRRSAGADADLDEATLNTLKELGYLGGK